MLAGQDRSRSLYCRAGLFTAMLGALVEFDQHRRVLGVAHVLGAAVRGRLYAVEVFGAVNRALREKANPAGYSVQLKGSRMVPQARLALGCQERRITRCEAVGIGLV